MDTKIIYRPPEDLHVFSDGIASIICALNSGRQGKFGTASVHASKKGFRIALNGKTLAKGRTGIELAASFKAAVERAKKA